MEKLPSYAEDIKRMRLLHPKWVSTAEAEEVYGVSKDRVVAERAIHKPYYIKKVGNSLFVDIHQMPMKDDVIIPRKWAFERMFDNIYFALKKYLNDNEISKLMAAFDHGTVTSWYTYLNSYEIKMNERAWHFIKYGKLILRTRALYRNFEKKEDYEILY